jgi:RNA polymerase sigma-70 factor, ECF subfamily
MSDVDDSTLLAAARRADEEAFSQLFARHARAVFRYATYLCGRDAADDVVQETFLAVLRQRDRRDAPEGSVQAYLLGIARHMALKRVSAPETWTETPLEAVHVDERATTAEPTTLDAMTQQETVAAIRAAVNALPLPYREVIALCDLQEIDYAAAAGILQVPVGTVRSRLHRARALLAAKLSGRGEPAAPRER